MSNKIAVAKWIKELKFPKGLGFKPPKGHH